MRRLCASVLAVVMFAGLTACGKSSSGGDSGSAMTTTSQETTTATDSSTDTSTVTTDLTYYNFAKGVLDRECATCHAVPPTDGAPNTLRLDTYADKDGVAGAYSQRERIKARVGDGTMPPAGVGALTDEEVTKLVEWVAGGAVEGTSDTPVPLVPTIKVLAPDATGAAANASFEISVGMTDISAGATWSAFYTQTLGVTTGGTLIADGIAATTTSLTWDSSGVAAGIYYVYVVLTDPNGSPSAASAGSVTVSHPEPGNTIPTVALTAPNGGEIVVVGTSTSVTWTISDPDSGDVAGMVYKIEYSSNGGVAWTDLASNLSGTAYTWNVPGGQATSQQYLVRVTADDGKGGIATDQSDAVFEIGSAGIANPTYADFDNIAKVVDGKCAGGGCHDNGGAGRNDYTSNQASVDANKAAIISRLVLDPSDGASMPKTGSLTNAQRQTMLNYLNQ